MAITAVAAAASMGAVGAGIVAAETITMVGIAASVVGTVTKNPLLSKLGAGASLGSLVAGAADLAPAAASATAPAATAEALSQTPTAVTEALAQTPTAAPTPTPTAAPTPSAAPGVTYDAKDARAWGPQASSSTPIYDANDARALAAQPAAAAQPAQFSDARFSNGYGPAVESANSALPDKGSSGFMKWFNDLDKTGKLAVGQAASGLISGVGKGAFDYMAAQEAQKLKAQQQSFEHANLSGNAPKVGLLTNARTTRA
jgi:hypothetical protein